MYMLRNWKGPFNAIMIFSFIHYYSKTTAVCKICLESVGFYFKIKTKRVACFVLILKLKKKVDIWDIQLSLVMKSVNNSDATKSNISTIASPFTGRVKERCWVIFIQINFPSLVKVVNWKCALRLPVLSRAFRKNAAVISARAVACKYSSYQFFSPHWTEILPLQLCIQTTCSPFVVQRWTYNDKHMLNCLMTVMSLKIGKHELFISEQNLVFEFLHFTLKLRYNDNKSWLIYVKHMLPETRTNSRTIHEFTQMSFALPDSRIHLFTLVNLLRMIWYI